jgi:hypothetical protein
VIGLERQLRGKGWLVYMSEEKWLYVLLRAMAPGRHEPPRYQLIMEKRQGSQQMEFVRPRAVRTVSGHSSINILDPERIAAPVPEGILAHISGIFHITEMENLPNIFRHGLRPGGRHEFSRQDVHFVPFFPLDPRNEYMQSHQCRKLRIRKDKARTSLIVLSIRPQVLWEEEVRICLANGFC